MWARPLHSEIRDFIHDYITPCTIKRSGRIGLDLGLRLGKRNSRMYPNWKLHHATLLNEVKRNPLSRRLGRRVTCTAVSLRELGTLTVDRDGEWLVLKARTELPSQAICALCHLFCSCSLRNDADQMVPATQDIVSLWPDAQCSRTSFYASLGSGRTLKMYSDTITITCWKM